MALQRQHQHLVDDERRRGARLGVPAIGTPTNDYYGGHRLGDNLFAESLVAVDVETGQRQWHFQTIHHGLWDYDLPAAPNLLDITVDGREIKAVAQVSKQGFVYVFDRVTGEPVWPIEELPVATDTDLEGEVMSPTQPFPTRPAAFEYQGTSIDDLVDFTPEIRQMAVEAVEGFRLGPLYTPQTLRGTIMRPPVGGGASWSGAAVDPETGYLYVPSTNGHSTIQLTEPEAHEPSTLRYIRRSVSAGPVMPRGLPLWKPPYTRMTAIDMNTGEHAWMVPTGDGDRIRNHPMLRDLDLPPVGGDASRSGPLLTKTLLIYALTAGGSDGGPRLVACDKATGAEIASVDLPSGGPRRAHDLPSRRRAAHRADRGRRGTRTHLVPIAGVILAMTANVGEISVDFELENPVDREIFERGVGEESGVRRTRVQGIVDTGAMMLVLPGNIVERLGLRIQETVVVTYADNRKEERPVAGPVTVRIGDRSTRTDCVVGPPSGEVLIGQIILEALDLIADCTNRTLTPRMPDYPLLRA